MNVARDVILDLLPLYIADEASPATRALVDEFLDTDPALARSVLVERAAFGVQRSPVASPDLELRALRRTRFLLACQRWLFGLAWFFTAIAFSVRLTIEEGRLRQFHLLLSEFPIALAATLLAAAGSWTAYYVLRRRTRQAGV